MEVGEQAGEVGGVRSARSSAEGCELSSLQGTGEAMQDSQMLEWWVERKAGYQDKKMSSQSLVLSKIWSQSYVDREDGLPERRMMEVVVLCQVKAR